MTGRVKRHGLAVHRLRLAADKFLQWFWFCLRYGIVGNYARVREAQVLYVSGAIALGRFKRLRRSAGLELPYGAVAERLGLLPVKPPESSSEPAAAPAA